MTRHKERFHQAAKDNYLDLLREATRSECDAVDDNGMTPVMWAAFYGHLEALRVLMGRGADPDRADHMGSTALHFAALNGRMNCVTYLVNFGANIWTLDVDLHSALDLAALNEHRDIVDFLDDVAGRQAEVNKRTVAKMREKAVLEAQRRAKKRDKLMKKADRRAARESSDACDLHPSATNPNYRHAQGSASTSAVADGVSVVLERTNQTARPYSNIVAGSPSPSGAAATGGGAFFSSATSPNPKLQRSPMPEADIMYARSADGRSLASASAAASAAGAAAEPPRGVPGLFERPGFGNVAFLQPPQPQSPQSPNSLNPHPRTRRTRRSFQTRRTRRSCPSRCSCCSLRRRRPTGLSAGSPSAPRPAWCCSPGATCSGRRRTSPRWRRTTIWMASRISATETTVTGSRRHWRRSWSAWAWPTTTTC
ncbi:hypothetical protein BOX15_Mlig022693g2 [Macrostomum lignano]|uniref:Uncharacterized protein n=1 Tax=Macrostomum lignano TaxID=282301 RepID=A0A267GCM3_9PLAT|nr:hypothetical protein BOX15_Mlig022693g2 [Macrostomum lignano]